MSLSSLALVLFVFLQSAALLNWFSVSATFLGVVGLIFVVLRVLESLGAFSYSLPARRHAAAE